MQLNSVKIMIPFVHDILEKTAQNKMIAQNLDQALFIGDSLNQHCSIQKLRYESEVKKHSYGYIYKKPVDIAHCSFTMLNNTFEHQKTKVLKGIPRCGYKFCLNCIKARQLTRILRFRPALDAAMQDYDLYHMVLTVPNCFGHELNSKLGQLHEAFTRLTKMLLVNKKPRKEFVEYGCVAALRSSEITVEVKQSKYGRIFDDYHPHLHVILALKTNLILTKDKVHKRYSFKQKDGKRVLDRHFCDFELLLQKVWFLIINNKKFNNKNLKDYSFNDGTIKKTTVKDGYSVTLDPVDEDSYYEVFKYAVKMFTKDSDPFTLIQQKTLDEALHGRRTMQGYGLWYGLKCDDEIDESHHEAKEIIEAFLRKHEEPTETADKTLDVFKDLEDGFKYTYLNFKNIYNIGNEDLARIVNEPLADKELLEALEKMRNERHLTKIEKASEAFNRLYKKFYKKEPLAAETAQYIDTLAFDKKGRLVVKGSLNHLKPKAKKSLLLEQRKAAFLAEDDDTLSF
ncbi:MAG: protein rep [Firmicutes bacterium]|nr:protein rep [Bacillota bacterium]